MIQNIKFKGYTSYTAISGINNTSLPILIIHGKNDETISYDKTAIYAFKNKVINKNVTFKLYDGKTHTSILYDNEAITYQQEVNKKIKEIKNYEEKSNYVSSVDDDTYSKVNLELLEEVINFYNNYI